MSRPPSPIVCDGPGCGKQKKDANHWWQIGVSKGSFMLIVVEAGSPTGDSDSFAAYDFCGQTCALKFISEHMGKASVQSPENPQVSNQGAQGGQDLGRGEEESDMERDRR